MTSRSLAPRVLACLFLALPTAATAQTASIREEVRSIETYPFSEPDPAPILDRDERLYPYHAFQGYSTTSEPRDWKVVTLENDYIQVFVLPEVGGKVWGAVIKETGEEFIYRNEVMKFRNISLRGPWTSGGIEFNFGVIGHTPATATPVDYQLVQNPDGSVSCWVGTMDLPSRTHWRVEIRLDPDKSFFETNVLWYNPTPTWQPYYNWMTAAAFARDDLVMAIPGNRFLGHPGESHAWPMDDEGRFLPAYRNNTFGGHKSFHVVGEREEFFGGYYRDADFGFGHWARHEEMPGQKLWLWALSRTGGIWEDLLTDTDGQYVEYQAGRLLVQYSPSRAVNPISQASFDPGSADRWSEIWFPVVGTGGLSDVSRRGVIHVERVDQGIRIGVNAFAEIADTLRVLIAGDVVASVPVRLAPLQVFGITVPVPDGAFYEVEAPAMQLRFSTDRSDKTLARPYETESSAMPSIPPVDRQVAEARELVKARRLSAGRALLEAALEQEPWNRDALVALADLDFRTARYGPGLEHIERARQLDAYDAEANFVAGNLYRGLGKWTDAQDAFGWAARSMAFRSAANVQLADLSLIASDWQEAARSARVALDYDRYNLPALGALSIALRRLGQADEALRVTDRMLSIDPLNHAARAEAVLLEPSAPAAEALVESMRSEYPEQTVLELVVDYINRGQRADASRMLTLDSPKNPVLVGWGAYLGSAPLENPTLPEIEFAFPYRAETLPVMEWAASESDHWSWTYLHALNLWALGQTMRAQALMDSLGNTPDLSSFYIARAGLPAASARPAPGMEVGDEAAAAGVSAAEADLLRAQELWGAGRLSVIRLIRFYQDASRWEAAARWSLEASREYSDDFNLSLLHARSLLQLGRSAEAVDILETVEVLPSENARTSHQLFEWAHIMAGLEAMDIQDPSAAADHFARAAEWPENLGQGRPYQPEERLPKFLQALAFLDLGRDRDAQALLETVAEITQGSSTPSTFHSLGVSALERLGRSSQAKALEGSLGSLVLPPTGSLADDLLKRALSL